MKEVSKKDLVDLIAAIPDGSEKRRLVSQLLGTGELTEDDIASLVVRDIEINAGLYGDILRGDPLLQFLWQRFREHPTYLARALVRARPDVFYSYGFAFRLVVKLKADLGPVLIAPVRPGNEYMVSRYMKELPELIQKDLLGLDIECRFREVLFFMTRDQQLGFEFIDEAITAAASDYDHEVYNKVRAKCEHLWRMQFPGFVTELHGQIFPSFHVRWWLDQVENVSRALNMGDTSTHKTAFSVIAMHQFARGRTLIVCPPHARPNWGREVGSYFFDPVADRTLVVRNRKDAGRIKDSAAEFTVVGYSTLIEEGVVEALEAAGFTGFVWDECHYGSHLTGSAPSQRAVACARLIRNLPLKRLLALSATPLENDVREFAPIAAAMRPDIFPTAEEFESARLDDPRFLREFFAQNIVEVGAHEVRDLPRIQPLPWEDLFSPVFIDMNLAHATIYNRIKEDTETVLAPAQKAARLLLTAIHPHAVRGLYPWAHQHKDDFERWQLSSKLTWLKERVTRELEAGSKVVIASGIYAEGITRPGEDADDEIWVGKLLKEWFASARVLILDGTVSQTVDQTGSSDRDRLIARWRNEPEPVVLLVSTRACPDAVNLSVPATPRVKKLFVTALSYPWVPWKQFLGRFWRDGLGVPMEYAVPILRGTIDEALLRLVVRKWWIQQLFRAQVPLTDEEWRDLDRKIDLRRLAEEARTSIEKVNIIGSMMRGRGEQGVLDVLSDVYGVSTNGAVFAQAFMAIQDTGTSGNIARFMRPVIKKLIEQGLVHPEGILDAGCGLLTLERFCDLPVHGVDLNSNMIELARSHSNHRGKNAEVGFLSKLREDWTGKFELTVASLVLDWTSLLKDPSKSGLPERLAILAELVRVTHPHGRIWITATHQSMNEETLNSWVKACTAQGFQIIDDLTGLVRATDSVSRNEHPFAFWSLCFTPNGRRLSSRTPNSFRYLFEVERVKVKRGENRDTKMPPLERRQTAHVDFEIVQTSGAVQTTDEAAIQAATREVERLAKASDLHGWCFHNPPTLDLDWRVLAELHRRGVLNEELQRRNKE